MRVGKSREKKEKMEGEYKKLIVWQEAKSLVVLVYELTKNFPKSEEFGLKSQMRRAAISIMSNIAEGWLRRSKKDKLHFLEISEGSLLELESQAEVCLAVGYWNQKKKEIFNKQQNKVAYLLFRYKSKIGKN
jgi:four helix bundle protein